jgi:hypothetical protein
MKWWRSSLITVLASASVGTAASGCGDGSAAPSRAIAQRVGTGGPGGIGLDLGVPRTGIKAEPIDAQGAVVGPPVQARWTSSDTTVVGVEPVGTRVSVTARRLGEAAITATGADASGQPLTGRVVVFVVQLQ